MPVYTDVVQLATMCKNASIPISEQPEAKWLSLQLCMYVMNQ